MLRRSGCLWCRWCVCLAVGVIDGDGDVVGLGVEVPVGVPLGGDDGGV